VHLREEWEHMLGSWKIRNYKAWYDTNS
jgi:hypothetical protein